MSAWHVPTSIPILTFHAIDDQHSVIAFRPSLFQRAMAKLFHAGYGTVGLLDVVHSIARRQIFPDRAFAITFDDGYRSVYEHAFPILQQYNFSATVFLTAGKNGSARSERLPCMNGRSMLSWGEIKEMQRSGIRFGAHTLTHPDLTRLPPDRLQAEVCESQAVIEDALGIRVASFAYPYGRYDDRCREIVREHFACACSDKLGFVTADSDLYALERVDGYYLRSEQFNLMPTPLFRWYIRARNLPRQIRRCVELSRDRSLCESIGAKNE